MKKFNSDLANVDLMTFLNTNQHDQPATIDEHGNIERRTQPLYSYAPEMHEIDLDKIAQEMGELPGLHDIRNNEELERINTNENRNLNQQYTG